MLLNSYTKWTDENEIRPVTEYEEYDVGDIPDEFKKLNQNK